MATTGRFMAGALLALLVLAAFPAAAASGDGWKGLVRTAACVQGPDVLLGEIADPANGEARAQWATLSTIKLWKAAEKPGYTVVVTKERLAKILRYYMGDRAGNLVLPDQMAVQTGGRVIDGPELKSRIVDFLTPRGKALGGEIEFKDLRMPDYLFFPDRHGTLELSMDDKLKPGHNRVKLTGVSAHGKVVFRKAASFFANVWKAVPVAAEPMNRNERVTSKKIDFRRMNLAYNPDVWDGKGGPWRMARTLGRGQPYTMSHLEPVPLIEKGEVVYLTYQGKQVHLTIKAVALGEAGMGQKVEVRNTQSNRTVVATVIGNDTVLVK